MTTLRAERQSITVTGGTSTQATSDRTVVNVDGAVTITVTLPGPVGVAGPSGPSGPPGPVAVPSFYESSTPPLGPDRGDQWIVTTELGG